MSFFRESNFEHPGADTTTAGGKEKKKKKKKNSKNADWTWKEQVIIHLFIFLFYCHSVFRDVLLKSLIKMDGSLCR